MCHYRGSYVSKDQVKAEADRRKELEAKRTQTIDKLRNDADQAAKTAPASEKEPIPAK